MVTGNNSTPSFVWWSASLEVDFRATPDVYLTHDGRRFPFLVTFAQEPFALGALNSGDIAPLVKFLGAQSPRVISSSPSKWCTLIPDALWPSFEWSPALFDAPKNAQSYRSVHQKIHSVYIPNRHDLEITGGWGVQYKGFWPSEALDWELPPVAPGRSVVVLIQPDGLHISAFERGGTLVFYNRFEASTSNDALYALGLVYEHLNWSGIDVPLFWHGYRSDWEAIAQSLGTFVLEIKPLGPPKTLPESLGDWRVHTSFQTLYRLWLCAS